MNLYRRSWIVCRGVQYGICSQWQCGLVDERDIAVVIGAREGENATGN